MSEINENNGLDIIDEMRRDYAEKMARGVASVKRAFDTDPETARRIAALLEDGVHPQCLRSLRNDELLWLQQLAALGFIHVLNTIREHGEKIITT